MPDLHYTIQDNAGKPVSVIVKRDKRLKKTSRWGRQADGSLLVRVPVRLNRRAIDELLKQLTRHMERAENLVAPRIDRDLQQRAEEINRKHFGGGLHWLAIRWVDNMQQRLGSCSRGGPTDGHIRISARIRTWPDWVVDYVIAHELLHRRHPNHSPVYWDELKSAYPLTERAVGFIKGVGFAQGQSFEADD